VSTSPLTDENGNSPNGTNILNQERVHVIDPITGEPVIGPNGEPFYRQVPSDEFEEPEEIGFEEEGPLNWETYSFIDSIPPELVNYDVEIPVEDLPEETASPEPEPEFVPEVEVTEAASITGDTQLTDCGTLNWCNAGEPWGDGRCSDPDPDVSSWYWNAGWYNAQLACGSIETIPEEFAPIPNADPAVVEAAAGFYVEITHCLNNGAIINFTLTAHNIPSNVNLIGVTHSGNTYLNVLNPPSTPGPDSGSFSVSYTEVPLTGAFVGYSGQIGLTPIPLSGPTSC
jgi:hypothetical protein